MSANRLPDREGDWDYVADFFRRSSIKMALQSGRGIFSSANNGAARCEVCECRRVKNLHWLPLTERKVELALNLRAPHHYSRWNNYRRAHRDRRAKPTQN